MAWRGTRILPVLGVLAALAGGCGDAGTDTTVAAPATPPPTVAPTTLPPPPPTTSPPSATTTLPPATTTVPTSTTDPPPPPLRLRVLSYNIHHGEGEDDRIDLERIAAVINSVSPDLVGLQEVEQGTTRSEGVDQPAELGRLTGMDHVFGKNLDFRGGGFGNAILSRLPIHSSGNVLLPVFDDGEQRGLLVAEVVLADGAGFLYFLATHLDHRDDTTERLASAEKINALVAGLGGGPALLAGDLNDTPGSAPLEVLARNWAPAGDAGLATFPVAAPEKQIDFILYSPPGRWRVVEVRVLDEAVASDHRAIFAILELVP